MEKHTEPACMLCGNPAFHAIHRKAGWTYVRCTRCGLVALRPVPGWAELGGRYTGYLSNDPGDIQAWESMMRPVVNRSRRLLESVAGGRNGRVLDVGCGYGFFLGAMKACGWTAEGVEICEAGARHASERFGIPVFRRPLETLNLPGGSYDAVTLFYVIEHVRDPVATLEEVRRILRPGGTVLLRWPHTTPIVRLLGPLARAFDLYHTPYHLHDFSPATMAALLDRAGFNRAETLVGGHTLPAARIPRTISFLTGELAEGLFRATGGRVLLPGVSKTTLARRP